jgi:hypothetical protein
MRIIIICKQPLIDGSLPRCIHVTVLDNLSICFDNIRCKGKMTVGGSEGM